MRTGTRDACTQRKDHVANGHLQAKEKCCRRNRICWHLVPGFLAFRTMRKYIFVKSSNVLFCYGSTDELIRTKTATVWAPYYFNLVFLFIPVETVHFNYRTCLEHPCLFLSPQLFLGLEWHLFLPLYVIWFYTVKPPFSNSNPGQPSS